MAHRTLICVFLIFATSIWLTLKPAQIPKRIKNNRDPPKGWIPDVKALYMICQVANPRFQHNFIVPLLRKFVANNISSDYPTNSSQSDTLHNFANSCITNRLMLNIVFYYQEPSSVKISHIVSSIVVFLIEAVIIEIKSNKEVKCDSNESFVG